MPSSRMPYSRVHTRPPNCLVCSRFALLRASSYLIDYFASEASDLRVGAPVYFVVEGLDLAERPAQNLLCGLGRGPGGCLADSLVNTVAVAGMSPQSVRTLARCPRPSSSRAHPPALRRPCRHFPW